MMRIARQATFLPSRKKRNSGAAVLATVTALSVGVLAASVGESRAAVVGQWNFTLDAAFDLTQTMDTNGATPGGVSGTAGTQNTFWQTVPAVGAGNAPASIFWGAGQAPPDVSGITVGKTNVTGQFNDPGVHTANGTNGPGSYVGDFGGGGDGTGVTTGGGFIPTVNVTHHNEFIPNTGPFLDSTVLLDQLTLTPASGGATLALQIAFDVLFVETDNQGLPGGVDDIFAIAPQGGLMFDGDTLTQGFTFDAGDGVDQPYIAQLKLNGLQDLSDADCALAGAASGCKGLVTPEGLTSSFQAELAITAVPIPPAGILFLSALAGLGVIARRRKGAQAAAA